MEPKTNPETTETGDTPETAEEGAAMHLEEDLLVEEISIDGMCGVY